MFATQRYNIIARIMLTTKAMQTNNIHTTAVYSNANYYEVLGISQNSTQAEVKAAYYKLSMLYHPDKNKGSETAANKFRELSKAYEVLGNFKLRRLYDKGIIHTAGSYEERTEFKRSEVEDDPSTKFYKSRFTKSQVADSEGRTPIYNFDEWSKAHYVKSFERRQAAKTKHERTHFEGGKNAFLLQNEILLFSLIVISALIYFNFIMESSYDLPKEKSENAEENIRDASS